METYVVCVEDDHGEREVGPQFFTEANAKAYMDRLRKEHPTKSIWMEKKRAGPRPSLPLNVKQTK